MNIIHHVRSCWTKQHQQRRLIAENSCDCAFYRGGAWGKLMVRENYCLYMKHSCSCTNKWADNWRHASAAVIRVITYTTWKKCYSRDSYWDIQTVILQPSFLCITMCCIIKWFDELGIKIEVWSVYFNTVWGLLRQVLGKRKREHEGLCLCRERGCCHYDNSKIKKSKKRSTVVYQNWNFISHFTLIIRSSQHRAC